MSWDLIVFQVDDPPHDPKDGSAAFPNGWEPPEIGSVQSIRARISEALPKVSWSDPAWGTLGGSDFSLEFNIGEEVTSNFMIHARGNATSAVLDLMSATGWKILDTSTGKWMHLSSNPDEGREKFQTYLNKILDAPTPTKRPSLLKRIFRR